MSKSSVLQDLPIHHSLKNITEKDDVPGDSINNKPYAYALKEFIEGCDTPMTIGLQGDWGIGKTSMMNMIKGCLNNAVCVQVDFNTWSYSQFKQDEYLALACLDALIRKVNDALSKHSKFTQPEETLRDKVKNATDRVKGVMSAVRISVPGVNVNLGEAGDAIAGERKKEYTDLAYEMTKFKDEFQEVVNLWYDLDRDKNRIVVFIDDLDRVKPIKALELLEGIKNFIDVPGCVFVLAVDYEVVQSGMQQKLGVDLQKTSGKSFFDKIIQLPFAMPTNNYKLDHYIRDLLIKIGYTYFTDKKNFHDEDNKFLLDITVSTVGKNPRSIKRVINYADLLNKIRKRFTEKGDVQKSDMKVLYALICMQIAWPELFGYFTNNPTGDTIANLENWEFLDTLPEARKVLDRVPDEDAEKNKIATYFDTLFELLDKDDNGTIDNEEMEPVLKMMKLAKMTSTETPEKTRDYFINRFEENNKTSTDNKAKDFLFNAFKKSNWFISNELDYRKSGNRYVTLVHNRKQIGSLITLKGSDRQFVVRLAVPSETVIERLKSSALPDQVNNDLAKCVRPLSEEEAPLTGFGNTILDYHNMDCTNDEKVQLLNEIFRISVSG